MLSNPMELASFLKDQGMPEDEILKCLDGDEEAMEVTRKQW